MCKTTHFLHKRWQEAIDNAWCKTSGQDFRDEEILRHLVTFNYIFRNFAEIIGGFYKLPLMDFEFKPSRFYFLLEGV